LVQIKTRFGLRQSRFGEIVNGMRRQNRERLRFLSFSGDRLVTAMLGTGDCLLGAFRQN
jgi:hypothetical protein